jgi:hypothetical protein
MIHFQKLQNVTTKSVFCVKRRNNLYSIYKIEQILVCIYYILSPLFSDPSSVDATFLRRKALTTFNIIKWKSLIADYPKLTKKIQEIQWAQKLKKTRASD